MEIAKPSTVHVVSGHVYGPDEKLVEFVDGCARCRIEKILATEVKMNPETIWCTCVPDKDGTHQPDCVGERRTVNVLFGKQTIALIPRLYKVAGLKELGGSYADYKFAIVHDGKLLELPDDGHFEITGGEHFECYPRDGVSN